MAIDLESASILNSKDMWPVLDVMAKMGLAVVIGTLVGLEREHHGKAGVRTFALTALLCSMGGLLGGAYGPITLVFVATFVGLMNWREMIRSQRLALTTSVALAVVAFSGVMCGLGHVFAPAAACIVTAGFLALKQPISGFAVKVSNQELRSAILLAVLACVIYPLLPEHAIDPWGLVEPRANWVAVIAIAAIGFVNYILLKSLGSRGMEITAFFGGLVNSRQVIVELITRANANGHQLRPTAQRGVVLATAAMIIRNGLIVSIFSIDALPRCAAPLLLMLLTSMLLWGHAATRPDHGPPPTIVLESPFKLVSALKFGLMFLALNVIGGLAERHLGEASFYLVSAIGGLLSSASAITSAATLVSSHQIPLNTGANAIILSSIVSILSNIPLVRAIARDRDLRRAAVSALAGVAACGVAGAAITFAGVAWAGL